MKILFYCCEFAPEGKTGAIRPSKLAKYFKRLGADIDVLTKKIDKPIHIDLLADLHDVEIKRVKLKKLLPINDDGFWFSIYSIIPMVIYVRKKKPDYIFISVPVFLPILVVYLMSLIYRTKFVIDYRDLWRGDPYKPKSFKDKFLRYIAKFVEPIAMRAAYATIFISDQMRLDQEGLYGTIKNASVISTGFDIEDLAAVSNQRDCEFLPPGFKYYSHVGMLDWDMNVDAIISLIKSNKDYIANNKIKILFVGGKNHLIKTAFHENNIDDICVFIDAVDKTTALAITKLSSGVIVLGSSSPQRLNRKIFESIACNDNIFYFGNKYSPTAQVLVNSRNELIYDSEDDFNLVNLGFLNFINNKNNRAIVPVELASYTKEAISKKYYDLLVNGL